jgi:hypothetical protein
MAGFTDTWLMARCHACGALLFPGNAWCGQCGASVAEREALIAEVDSSSRPAVLPRWTPPEHASAPVPSKVYSRTKGTQLSFGLLGKSIITAFVVGLAWWGLVFGGPAAGLILFAFAGYVLKETWKRSRVR